MKAIMTAHLDEADLKKIITEYAELEFHRKVLAVKFGVTTHLEDRGGGSWPVFTGVDVELGDKIVSKYSQYDR